MWFIKHVLGAHTQPPFVAEACRCPEQATAAMSDGRVFVIGGSWNGGVGGKNGEVHAAIRREGSAISVLGQCEQRMHDPEPETTHT